MQNQKKIWSNTSTANSIDSKRMFAHKLKVTPKPNNCWQSRKLRQWKQNRNRFTAIDTTQRKTKSRKRNLERYCFKIRIGSRWRWQVKKLWSHSSTTSNPIRSNESTGCHASEKQVLIRRSPNIEKRGSQKTARGRCDQDRAKISSLNTKCHKLVA